MRIDQDSLPAERMLHHVRELGKSPEPGVVVLGSWLDRTGPLAPSVCVVYKNAKHPHLADKLIGIRWPVSESTGCGEGEVQEPREWAFALFSYHIEEPLGSTVGRLRYDAHGIGWFGYAVDPLPPIPEDLLRLLASDKRG